ncbi:non-lysosomal glucosylceramidase isoform X3 [Photinus pyralis]|uniref:non-lysosomal glucosylceramidase isoform X3 n=1 Tax=Photinus pyralis TaxID=7054 RepID=UPI00126706C2|nr:non-lysosomal glucosylceramidase isoform X3 [Photinus pyralis]
MDTRVTDVSVYGLKLKLEHTYPENWLPGFFPKWSYIWTHLSLLLRFLLKYFISTVIFRRPLVVDILKQVKGKGIYGVPIGGIGFTIGRGFRGEFCRYHLKPGYCSYTTVEANEFIVTIKDAADVTIFQSTLSTYERSNKILSSWKQRLDASKCKYTGLYPRAWTEYDLSDYGIKLICRQVSPVIPHNYKDSSLPCAVFIWNIENISNEERKVTIAFTFKNGMSDLTSKSTPCSTQSFSYLDSSGVTLRNYIEKMPCTYALAAKLKDNMNVSKCLYFNPTSDGAEPWNQLYDDGNFSDLTKTETDEVYDEVGCGIAVQVKVAPGAVEEPEMCLVWDMPIVSFPEGVTKYNKFYTKYFGVEKAALKIVNHALRNYKDWELAIYKWQEPVLNDAELPDWYKAALFNETYFISDGGTVWFTLGEEESERLPVTDPRQKYGRFGYLEGHEYRMYNTYDVHFYASFALAMNWPNLQKSMQYDFKDYVFLEDHHRQRMWYDGKFAQRKIKNSVPHDSGDSNGDPFVLINVYPVHDVSEWKDLNSKFVLQALRDYKLTMKFEDGSFGKQYLEDMYKACHVVMQKSMTFDTDHDGLIENSGFPDQTYDAWIMTGSSAYCGGLWLAALYAMVVIARELNKNEDENMYAGILEKAKTAFEDKLWNGKFYNFDCSKLASSVMADQLCGHWYLRCSGFEYEVFPKSNVESALNTIFENNVMRYKNGTSGAVNGYIFEKEIDTTALQSEEVWTGVTYSLASCMIYENLNSKAWKTIGGMVNLLTNRIGLAFETPEALGFKHYRSVGYMRPLSIWAVQLAWESQRKNSALKPTFPIEDMVEKPA